MHLYSKSSCRHDSLQALRATVHVIMSCAFNASYATAVDKSLEYCTDRIKYRYDNVLLSRESCATWQCKPAHR